MHTLQENSSDKRKVTIITCEDCNYRQSFLQFIFSLQNEQKNKKNALLIASFIQQTVRNSNTLYLHQIKSNKASYCHSWQAGTS